MAPLEGMPHGVRPDPLTPGSLHSRSFSMSSDRTSMTGFGGMLSPPTTISPEAIFIAASAASQIVTNDHDSRSDTWFDQHGIEPSGETALVAPAALKLVNKFLDQLLFNFLCVAKSTSLAALRPAVSEVLKPKLAKDAISGADQELHEYLGGGEDEELLDFHNESEAKGDWDIELVWKRTRLRCMVYSSLGDMEEEDEDMYTEQEQLDAPNRFSSNSGVVSPAVAIFLTSILEFMGEQALIIAGQAAYHRLRAKYEKDERDGAGLQDDIADRVVVEEADMERVALDRTLGRLWRGWKKLIRSPTTSMSMSRSFSRESMRSRNTSRRGSTTNEYLHQIPDEASRNAPLPEAVSKDEVEQEDPAFTTPLPMTDDDVREIEIPGLVANREDDEDELNQEWELVNTPRPKSMLIFPNIAVHLPEEHDLQSTLPIFLSANTRKRSNSLPSSYATPSKRYRSSLIFPADTASEVDTSSVSEDEVVAKTEEHSAPTSEDEKSVPEELEKSGHSKGVLAGIMAGATAVGVAAVVGIAAAARGEAPKTSIADEPETDEDLNEEPQIMTSSRVSIGGRVSPEERSMPSRRSSVRSLSVHSLRLVDVTAPRSPDHSRTNSAGADSTSSARRASVGMAPNPTQRGATASPVIIRNGSGRSMRNSRGSAEESISEIDEKVDSAEAPSSIAAVAASLPSRSPLRDSSATITPLNVDSAAEEKSFALTAAPKSRDVSISADQVVPPGSSPMERKISERDSGAPPLTPLREMMEGAADTSDEASSIAPSSEDTYDPYNHSRETSMVSPLPIKAVTRSVATERSIRTSPKQVREDDMSSKADTQTRTPTKSHTSGSSTSSQSHKIRPVRTSEDSIPSVGADKGRSFEQLIQSDQTIQYTLTPQNMRQMEVTSAILPKTPTISVNGQQAMRPRTPSHTSSISRATGLNSNPTNDTPRSIKSARESMSQSPRQPPKAGSRVRPGAPQARDARVERDSVGDFADFIRSTGPPGAYDASQPRSSVMNGHRGTNGTPRSVSSSTARPGVAPANSVRRSESSAAKRSRLQAREAVVPYGDTSSDLIDFIRQGPPSEKNHDNPRIPRTVAPFRTTMDSDQMSGAVGGRALDAAIPEVRYSAASTERSTQSMHSSVTSQSALLSNNHNSYKNSKPLPPHKDNAFEEEDMMPKRKTRRVLDPYAIDFSDEEEDEFDEAPTPKPKPKRQEESLIDFLNSVPPPPSAPVVPFQSSVVKPVIKKQSSHSLMSRFGRRDSTSNGSSKPASSHGGSRANNPAPIPATKHVPLASAKNPSQTQNYGSVTSASSNRPNYVSQLDNERKPRVIQKSYQPREVYSGRGSGTNDLADFLKNTPPPPSNGRFEPIPMQKEETGGFSRMFGRKKKSTA